MKISKSTYTKKITVTIGYEVKPDGVLCVNGDTARLLWGSTIAITDLSRHIKKMGDGKYFIPKDILIRRQQELYNKQERIREFLRLQNEITKEWGITK